MSNYSSIISSVPIVTMFDSRKGDLSNRMSCAGEQYKNNIVESAKSVVVAGAAAGTAYSIKRNPAMLSWLGKYLDKGLKKLVSIAPKYIQSDKIVKKALNTSGKTKALAFLGAIFVSACSKITTDHAFRAGQIDQKYTDRAKIEAHNKDVLA
ncbi:hypothetical protein J6G99_02265 [bacterium]|nr:hypothetical protein [bacterium]